MKIRCRWSRAGASLGASIVVMLLATACSNEERDVSVSQVQNVFGNDDRIVAPDVYPYRAVGRLDSGCTGTLISDSLVLTGAHCVVDAATGSIKQNLGWFRPNFRNNEQSGAAAWITRAWVGSENPEGNRLRDFAVVELDQPLGRTFGSLAVRDFRIEAQVPFGIDLIGYSTDRDQGAFPTLHRGCQVREIVQGRLFHDCDASAGVSGGPLLNAMGPTTFISGITVSEYRNGEPNSVHCDAYEKTYANVAISTAQFGSMVNQLLSSVARGLSAPVIPDVTLKINPIQRPQQPSDTNYSVDRVASESVFMNRGPYLIRLAQDLRYSSGQLMNFARNVNDPQLVQLSGQLAQNAGALENVYRDAAAGFFRGRHSEPVFYAWRDVRAGLSSVRTYPQSAGRSGLQPTVDRYSEQMEQTLNQMEAVIFF